MPGSSKSTGRSEAAEPPPSDIGEAEEIRLIARDTRLVRVSPRRFTGGDKLRPVVISVIRNERPRLADFLRHYRRIGARHFLFVDNGSTDGSREFLAGREDVDLLAVEAPFNAANKHGWITRLIQEYGDRWYFLADADEHAVFAGAADLREVTRAAQRLGSRRVRAMLLDMYGDKPVASVGRRPNQPLLDAYPFFDADGYIEARNSVLTALTGGPRRRVFSTIDDNFAPQLTKYPLFRLADNETAVSPHYIYPPLQGDDPCWIALLHFKFDADAPARIADAVSTGQYWRASYEYRVYQEALDRFPDLSLMMADSQHYRAPGDLVRLGLIETVGQPDTQKSLQWFRGILRKVAGK